MEVADTLFECVGKIDGYFTDSATSLSLEVEFSS